jgi:hypothetical protein
MTITEESMLAKLRRVSIRRWDAADVAVFLDEDLGHLDRCDLSDDHPFANPWHDGSWVDVALKALSQSYVWDLFQGDADAEDFIEAVGKLAMDRGYDNGVGRYDDNNPEDVDCNGRCASGIST